MYTPWRHGITWGGLFWSVAAWVAFFAPVLFLSTETGFFTRFWLSWMSLAAFCGMAPVVAARTRDVRACLHLVVAAVIVWCFGVFLRTQHAFTYSTNLFVSILVIAGLAVCCSLNRNFPHDVQAFCQPITVFTLWVSAFWGLASPPRFFMPLMFHPAVDLREWREVYLHIFLASAVGAALVCGLVIFLHRNKAPEVEGSGVLAWMRSTIPRSTGIKIGLIFTAVLLFAAAVLYFIPGTSSISGGMPYPYFSSRAKGPMDTATAVKKVSSLLESLGASQTEKAPPELRYYQRPAPQLASFEYPLHGSRKVDLAIVENPDRPGTLLILYRCEKVSAFDFSKAEKFRKALKQSLQE